MHVLPGRYEVVRELGASATGAVIECRDRERGVHVAWRWLSTAGCDGERVRRELALAAAVAHPNLVRIGELHDAGGAWGVAMELVDGPPLAEWVRRDPTDASDDGLAAWGTIEGLLRPRFLEGRVRTAIGHIAGALAALHGAGIVHRGLRPSGLRVDRGDRVVVLDLHLAALAERRGEPPSGVVEYLAPEEVGGAHVTTASDLYALGAILFELVTGRPPFVGAPADVAADKLELAAPRATELVPELARDLDELCARLLDRDPARRPSAADVAAQFGAANQAPHLPRAGVVAPRARRDHPLVGRDAELGELVAALDGPAPRVPLVYLVHGPLGVGKTALFEAVARAAAARGALVCAGRGGRGPRRFGAWDGFLDGLARHLAALAPAARAAALPVDAAAITHLSPSFARVAPARPSSDATDVLIARGVAALRELLGRLARGRRLIAILDHLDDAGDDSLELLRRVIAAPAPALTILLGVRRADGLARALAALPIELRALAVAPLDAGAARAIAERLGAADPAALVRRAGGIPLLLEQLARWPAGDHRDVVPLLAARLDALPASTRTVVRAIAAAGGPLRQDVLGSALGLTHRALTRELTALADGLLVRVTGSRRNDLAELFHDAIGDAVRRGAPLTAEHALLAAAFDMSGLGDDRTRLRHWLAAGDRDRAGALAIAMVARARDGLELAAAGAACRDALALAQPAPTRAALLRARADARAGTGELAGAAEDYLLAAAAADGAGSPDEALDARRLAAEHLLGSGQVERGFTVAQAVAHAADLELAMTSGRLIGTLLIERARSRLRGTRIAAEPDRGAARLADVCASLAAGFGAIDVMRAAWFTSRGVRAALDSGDRTRVARALAFDACALVARGEPGVARARRALARADELVARTPDPPTRALITAARGATAFLVGDLAEAVTLGDAARAAYRACPPRHAAEGRAATVYVLTAVASLGCWADAARRRAELVREATAGGDRHGVVAALTGHAVIGELAAGTDPGAIRAAIAEATRPWPRDLAPAIFAREVIALAVCDLYQGQPDAASARLAAAWGGLDEAYLVHVEHLRASLLELSARAALRCGDLAEADVATRKLAAIGWAAGPARLLHAAIAIRRGDRALARAALVEGLAACDAAHLAAHAAAARDRLARLDGTTADGEVARAAARELGLGDPARAFDFLLPWR